MRRMTHTKRSNNDEEWAMIQEENLNAFFSAGLINLLTKVKKTIEEYSLAPSMLINMSGSYVLSVYILRPTEQSNKEDNRIALSEALTGLCVVPSMTNVFCTVAIDPENTSKRTLLINYCFSNNQTITAFFPYSIAIDENNEPSVKWNTAEFGLSEKPNEINEILSSFHLTRRAGLMELAVSMRELMNLNHKLFFSSRTIGHAVNFDLIVQSGKNIRMGDAERKQQEAKFNEATESLYGSLADEDLNSYKDLLMNKTDSKESLETFIEENILVPLFH